MRRSSPTTPATIKFVSIPACSWKPVIDASRPPAPLSYMCQTSGRAVGAVEPNSLHVLQNVLEEGKLFQHKSELCSRTPQCHALFCRAVTNRLFSYRFFLANPYRFMGVANMFVLHVAKRSETSALQARGMAAFPSNLHPITCLLSHCHVQFTQKTRLDRLIDSNSLIR